ncbi:cytochrome P450 [Mycena belliarum]|uniref:Cytochrome P450 n=1 Tax=Mycena belliarum TaxID=1033014 RepID=A0AAD6TXX9_9AGAR|nr:cytochrome P450 [Mycena belliae]
MDSPSPTTLYTVLLLLLLTLYLLSDFLRLLIRQARSPLTRLRGPPCPSFFMGNLAEMHDQENTDLVAAWEAAYGSTFVYRGFVGGCRLMTTDPAAVAHILGNAYDYPKPDFVRDSLATMAAGHDGLLTVEGDAHRRQRKILTPAFSSSHIKSLTPIFWDKATQLRDIWLAAADEAADANASADSTSTNPSAFPGYARVDVLMWLGRATLDAIGLAGFGYHFNSLTGASDELAHAFGVIFSTARRFRVMTILQVWFPFLRRFRRNNAVMTHAHATMRRIGLGLIAERSRAVVEEQRRVLAGEGTGSGAIEGDKTLMGRDILSVLIRSNSAATAKDGAAKDGAGEKGKEKETENMSVNEVLCQISTFLAAGHETTASALTWCLYALVQHPLVQRRLRAALRGVEREVRAGREVERTHAGLNTEEEEGEGEEGKEGKEEEERHRQRLTARLAACEYLDWVVRETLRLHAPITSTMRVCMRDEDEIPVTAADGTDNKGCLDRSGTRLYGIRVKRGDIITIPIQAINKSRALWGVDTRAFRPERWAAPPAAARAIPGLYSNTLTFLNGNPLDGNRACIGYKFALIEIKIFLYTLLKDIEFRQDPAMVIEKKVNVVTRPFVKSEPALGNQMPLYIRRAPPSPPPDADDPPPVSVSVSVPAS